MSPLLRPLLPSSHLPAAATLCASAFNHTSPFYDFMHPYRHQYPDDYVAFWARKITEHAINPYTQVLVAVVDNNDNAEADAEEEEASEEKVVGIAIWERQGPSRREVRTLGWGARLHNLTTHLHLLLTNYLSPPRSASPANLATIASTYPLFAHHWTSSPSRANTWYLAVLAVHPDRQGHGYGKELVRWGTQRADADGVCASLIAGLGSEEFYGKMGFKEVGRANVGGLEGLEGGAVMFRD